MRSVVEDQPVGTQPEKVAHPICGHLEYADRIVPGSVCAACLRRIEREHAPAQPHPICGHLKEAWAHVEGSPCDWCLTDIEREYLRPQAHALTWDDIRGARRPLLEATDWIENQPARVARTDPAQVAALQAYRKKLFDITTDFPTPDAVVWPTLP